MALQGFRSRTLQGLTRKLQAFGSGIAPSRLLTGLTVADDVVYVCDYINHKILSYQLDGTKIDEWGTYGATDGLIDRPLYINWYDNELYVLDITRRIQVFSESGTWDRTIATDAYDFDIYNGEIFYINLGAPSGGYYPVTFKKTDTDGVVDFTFTIDDRAYGYMCYESGILLNVQYESFPGEFYYIINAADGSVSSKINIQATYPSSEAIQIRSITNDGLYLYSHDSLELYKHEIGGTFIDNALTGLSLLDNLNDIKEYDGKLYCTVNYSDPLVSSKIRIHSSSTLAFDSEWTAT
jgi:hypothetical protein